MAQPNLLDQLLKRLPPIVLVSASPRRTALLSAAGIRHRVVVRSTEECAPEGLPPAQRVRRIACRKLQACEDLWDRELVICADTVVDLDGRELGKPADVAAATDMLQALSGRVHQVHTAVALRYRDCVTDFTATTHVWFRRLEQAWIDAWVASGAAFDKAGGYGIQDEIGLVGISRIEGDYCNVVGLPVQRVVTVLEALAEELS